MTLLVYTPGPVRMCASCRFCGFTAARALVKSKHKSWLWVCRSVPACERRQERNGHDPVRIAWQER